MKFNELTSCLAAAAILLVVGCKKPAVIEPGKTVKINYTLTVDGVVADTSVGKEPLSYVQGGHQIIPGLEEQLVGLKVGDKKKVTVPPEKGYGLVSKDAQQKVPKKAFGNIPNLKIGQVVTGQNNGRPVRARVVSIGAKDVTLDFNHPLAGKTLNFDIEVADIQSSPANPPQQPPMQPAAHP